LLAGEGAAGGDSHGSGVARAAGDGNDDGVVTGDGVGNPAAEAHAFAVPPRPASGVPPFMRYWQPVGGRGGDDVEHGGDEVVVQLGVEWGISKPSVPSSCEARSEAEWRARSPASGCIGLALGLLDTWLGGQHRDVPDGLAEQTRLPDADWYGQPAAVDVLALTREGRAFGSLDSLHVRHHGHLLLYDSALALAVVPAAWGQQTGTPVGELVRTIIE
jgi:hypothetical protein